MLPRIKDVTPMPEYQLHVVFDDGKSVIYDVMEDIDLPSDTIYEYGMPKV